MAESWESKAIKKASEDWWKAYRKGDQAAMKKARNTAEKLRRQQGYSLNGTQKGNTPKVTDKTKWGKTSASKKIITTSTSGTKPKIDLGLGYTASNMSKLATLQKANPPEKKPVNGSANARARGALSTASKLPQGKIQEVRQNAGLPSISKVATLQSQQRKGTSENKKGNDASNAGSRSKFLVGARLSSSETQQRKGNAGGRSDLIRERESAVAKGTNTFPESGLRLSAYGKSVPAEGKNTLSNDKKKNILREAFDKEETYVDKFKRGNLGGGMANLLGTTLQAPQSLWLNLNNQISSVAQGKGLQPFHYNMDYGDYEGEVAKRAGTVPLGQQISEKNKVLGELYRLGMEMGTDPLTLLDAGGVLKTIGKNISGSPTQAKELLALKLAEQAEKERRLRALKEGLPRRGEMKISNTKPGNKGNIPEVVSENVKPSRKREAMQEEGLEKARALLKEKWYNSDRGKGYTATEDWIGGVGKLTIPKEKVREIIKTPKFSRPDPTIYLEGNYISNHVAKFNNGVTKISYQAPTGYAGPPGGTYVMPSSIADDLIARSGGNISKLEQLLGLPQGSLGNAPVRVDIAKPTGLRMPSGNEFGTNSNWIPGGYTNGGIPEIIIDSPAPGQYTIKPIK